MDKVMNVPGLMDELVAIAQGRCVWCRSGLSHPGYSRCERRAAFGHNAIDRSWTAVDVVGASKLVYDDAA